MIEVEICHSVKDVKKSFSVASVITAPSIDVNIGNKRRNFKAVKCPSDIFDKCFMP